MGKSFVQRILCHCTTGIFVVVADGLVGDVYTQSNVWVSRSFIGFCVTMHTFVAVFVFVFTAAFSSGDVYT